jgi:hypothetical protein
MKVREQKMDQENKKITALWTDNGTQNAYVFVGGLGWRRISISNDAQFLSMLGVCTAAYVNKSFVNFNETGVAGSIYITQIYAFVA